MISGSSASIGSTAQIGDGVIVNADINASAAIAQSKLNLSITNAEVNASAAIVDTKLAQITTASKVSGAALTSLASIPSGAGVIPAANLSGFKLAYNTQASKNAADASTTQNIAHTLGVVPKLVSIWAIGSRGTSSESLHIALVSYDGSAQSSASYYTTGAYGDTIDQNFVLNCATNNGTQTGVISWDATNIIITWTKAGSPTGSYIMIVQVMG